ncbi:MAG: EF-P lysine aminoacylase GenX [Oligoflexia bacterium]|nr:EF-P lysine aminoacylase GenX [Oligoflexia bacterium]
MLQNKSTTTKTTIRRSELQPSGTYAPWKSTVSLSQALRQSQPYKTAGRVVKSENGEIELTSDGVTARFKMTEIRGQAPINSIVGIRVMPNKPVHKIVDLTVLTLPQSANPFLSDRVQSQFKTLPRWNHFINVLRQFFIREGYHEVQTPTLVPSPGLEPYLDPFKTEFKLWKEKKALYLPTSPEFHLKKALAQGFEKVFELKECFRNGEKTEHHLPEFLMLEWYKAYRLPEDLISEIKDLFIHLSNCLKVPVAPVKVARMESIWSIVLGFELKPTTTAEDLIKLCESKGVPFQKGEGFDDLFHKLFIQFIEPWLAAQNAPYIVRHFPPTQCALARLTPEGWADRFEIYWKGLELANAFNELNDPTEQRKRFEADLALKVKLDKEVVPVDEEFLAALDWGMPPGYGIALGVERLFMAFFDLKTIKEVRLFPGGVPLTEA